MQGEEFGSLNLWDQLYKEPHDPALWKRFIRRYEKPVRDWARKWLRDPNDVDDVFAEFFKRVYGHISKPGGTRYEPRDGSFRYVLRAIVDRLCMDFLDRRSRHVTGSKPDEADVEHEHWKQRTVDGFFEGLNDDVSEGREAEPERLLKRLDPYRKSFRDALICRKTQPQFDPKSLAIFFRKYRDGIPTEQLDLEYGFKYRDGSGQYARRELVRLIKLMDLPTGTPDEEASDEKASAKNTDEKASTRKTVERASAERIVTGLARVFGDLSTQPE